jgi:putative CocE/NonD family hydrolase
MLENFKLIRKYAVDPVARDNQKLLMGPWFHGWGPRKVGAFDFGAQAAIKPDSLAIRWFDHWLKGEDNGVDREPPVRVFVMGENRWREATDWPIPGTQFTKFYLHSKGDARLEKGGGSLSISTPGEELADRYTYDPGNPTPELLDSNKVWVVGPADRTSVEKRPDVLVYTSDPIREPLEVTGPLTAVLYLATSAPSTDLFVNLLDVHPDGAGYNLFNTFTAPYRTHWAKEVENGPNGIRIIKAEISLYPTANVFLPGHRIRVEISSAAAPSVRGLNVEGGTEPSATKWNLAEQTIYHDRAHPSHIVLPVIPRSSEVASSITGAGKERP